MRILIIGFLALISWSALSTYIYVCKIRGFCPEQSAVVTAAISPLKKAVPDSIHKLLLSENPRLKKDFVIYFAFDNAGYTHDSTADKYAGESSTYLEKNLKSILSITGHADATGSENYNYNLGIKRAQTIKHYFESLGIPSNKIITSSKGETEPADNNNTDAGRAKNRRTVITINN